jgi:hypothetical protein
MEYNPQQTHPTFKIQAELYAQCKVVGLKCDLEYMENNARFDFVLVEYNQVLAIVEIKQKWELHRSSIKEQIDKYKEYGIPFFVLHSIYDIPYLIKKLIKIRDNYLKGIGGTVVGLCNEGEARSRELGNYSRQVVLDWFDKLFPNYEYTEKYSVGSIIDCIKKIGPQPVTHLISMSRNRHKEDNEALYTLFTSINAIIATY